MCSLIECEGLSRWVRMWENLRCPSRGEPPETLSLSCPSVPSGSHRHPVSDIQRRERRIERERERREIQSKRESELGHGQPRQISVRVRIDTFGAVDVPQLRRSHRSGFSSLWRLVSPRVSTLGVCVNAGRTVFV